MKVKWYKSWDEYGYTWKLLKPTGRTKVVTGAYPAEYVEHEHRFWFFRFRKWVNKDDIEEMDAPSVTISG